MASKWNGAAKRRGIVLIVVMGILTLLALLATSFATLQSIERKVTHNYLDEVRARFTAQSGVEAAITRLSHLVTNGWFQDGNEFDRSFEYRGVVPDSNSVYATAASPLAATRAQLHASLERALYPSFASESSSPDPAVQNPFAQPFVPRKITIEGQARGFSGYVGGTYGRYGDVYALRVTDCQGQININEGVEYGASHSSTQNLIRMLNILGEQAGVPQLGYRIIFDPATGKGFRPPHGFQHKHELVRLLGKSDFEKIQDFLTVVSWTNPGVCNPVPLSATEDVRNVYPIEFVRPTDGSGNKIYRLGHGKNRFGGVGTWDRKPTVGLIDSPNRPWPMQFFKTALNGGGVGNPGRWHAAIWNTDALNPQWIERVRRSPINLNTAAKEVLMAAVMDLQGFFVSSRRAPQPSDGVENSNVGYGFLWHRHNYDPEYYHKWNTNAYVWGTFPTPDQAFSSKFGEVGHLVTTIPFGGAGSTRNSGPGAGVTWFDSEIIVDEIIACRERQPSPRMPTVHYRQVEFGGPFRTRAQFNRFVDHLVEQGLLVDPRGIETFHDNVYASQLARCVPILSNVQKRIASQAMADVLKANFNPNTHLNELNPDVNVYTTVDKTDLLVNSTEFCFTPMGYFEIESVGTILLPREGTDCAAARDNAIVARAKVATIVQLFDAQYISTQSEFYSGDFGERFAYIATNNNRTVESGPEPDNGPQPMECRWDGYLALPTLGSVWGPDNTAVPKGKGELVTAANDRAVYPGARTLPAGQARMGETIRAHFTLDHVASYHRGGTADALPVGPKSNAFSNEPSLNFSDVPETLSGPYSPSMSVLQPIAHKYRLCQTFDTPTLPLNSSTQVLPPPPIGYKFGPSDIRIDGAHAELHSAFGYTLAHTRFSTRTTIAFWYKPNYYPECVTRTKTLVSLMDYVCAWKYTRMWDWGWSGNRYRSNPRPFSLHFLPYYTGSFNGTDTPSSLNNYDGRWIPPSAPFTRSGMTRTSFLLGHGIPQMSGGNGFATPSLNHEFESNTEDWNRLKGMDGRTNYLRHHEWIHVVMDMTNGLGWDQPWNSESKMGVYINGRLLPTSIESHTHNLDGAKNLAIEHGDSVRIGGELSYAGVMSDRGAAMDEMDFYSASRLYYGDGTFDEFYMWCDTDQRPAALDHFRVYGRYYKPEDGNPDDGVYTSTALSIPIATRRLPPDSNVQPPPSGSGTTVVAAPNLSTSKRRIVGIAWTALAEGYVPEPMPDGTSRMRPILLNHGPTLSGQDPQPVSPSGVADVNGHTYRTVAQLFLLVNGRRAGPYHNEGWSPVLHSHMGSSGSEGSPLTLEDTDELKFRVKFRVGPMGLGSILLLTPVLDDVTIFYDYEKSRFHSYAEVPLD